MQKVKENSRSVCFNKKLFYFLFFWGVGEFSRIHFLENLLIFLCLVMTEFSKKSLLLRECTKLRKTHAPFVSMKNFFFFGKWLVFKKTFYGILTHFPVFGRDIENELTTLTFSFFITPISLLLSCILFLSNRSHMLSSDPQFLNLITSMNPIFFSFQVLSLNSSPFSSPRISFSKKIGADWSLSLSLSVGRD